MIELDTGFYTITSFCARMSGRERMGSMFNIERFYGGGRDEGIHITLKALIHASNYEEFQRFIEDIRQDDEVFFKKTDRENTSRRFQESIFIKGTNEICPCIVNNVECSAPLLRDDLVVAQIEISIFQE